MTHSRIVASYDTHTLSCIVRDLTRTRQWPDRLEAAKKELRKRNTRK